MSDKYIWFNCTQTQIKNWLKWNGYKNSENNIVINKDNDAARYASFLSLIGAIGCSSTIIKLIKTTDIWIISGTYTWTFDNAGKVKIKDKNGNISYNTTGTDIIEINHTTSLKREAIGWSQRDSITGVQPEPTYPFNNYWFGYGDVQRKNNEISASSFNITPIDEDEGPLTPFTHFQNCSIPNYCFSEDGIDDINIRSLVFNGSIIDPLQQKPGTLLNNFPSQDTRPVYQAGFKFNNKVNFNGQSDADEKARHWNSYLYPLVILNSNSSGTVKQIKLTSSYGQWYVEFSYFPEGKQKTIKIPFDKDKDLLVKYSQDVDKVSTTLKCSSSFNANKNGTSYYMTQGELDRVWYDSGSGSKRHLHQNVYLSPKITIDFKPPEIKKLASSDIRSDSIIYPITSDNSPWSDCSSDEKKIFEKLIGTEGEIKISSPLYDLATSKERTWYDANFHENKSDEFYFSTRFGMDELEFDPYCAGCGSLEPYCRFYLSIDSIEVNITNLMQLDTKNDKALKDYYTYWYNSDNAFKNASWQISKQPIIIKSSVTDHAEHVEDIKNYPGHIDDFEFNCEITNLMIPFKRGYGEGYTIEEEKIYITSNMIEKMYSTNGFNIATKGVCHLTGRRGSIEEGHPVYIVLWIHDLDKSQILFS